MTRGYPLGALGQFIDLRLEISPGEDGIVFFVDAIDRVAPQVGKDFWEEFYQQVWLKEATTDYMGWLRSTEKVRDLDRWMRKSRLHRWRGR